MSEYEQSRKLPRFVIWVKLVFAVVPSIVFGVFTIIFTVQQNSFAQSARSQDQELASIQRKEAIFDNCLDIISALLIDPNFNRSNVEHLQPIQAKVLTTLRRLDADQKRDIIVFLHANRLIRTDTPPEYRLDLRGADLNDVVFERSDRSRCELNYLYLPNVLASRIVFRNCELQSANFTGSIMNAGEFERCMLASATFANAELPQTHWRDNLYWRTDFAGTILRQSSFVGTPNSFLMINWTNADLLDSEITDQQLFGIGEDYNTVFNTRLPNGTFVMKPVQVLADGGAERECRLNGSMPSSWSSAIIIGRLETYDHAENSSVYPAPIEGQCYFIAKSHRYLTQLIDVSGFSRVIGSGQARCKVSGYLGCVPTHPNDTAELIVGFVDDQNQVMLNDTIIIYNQKKPFDFQLRITAIPSTTHMIYIRLRSILFNEPTPDTRQYCAFDDIQLAIFVN